MKPTNIETPKIKTFEVEIPDKTSDNSSDVPYQLRYTLSKYYTRHKFRVLYAAFLITLLATLNSIFLRFTISAPLLPYLGRVVTEALRLSSVRTLSTIFFVFQIISIIITLLHPKYEALSILTTISRLVIAAVGLKAINDLILLLEDDPLLQFLLVELEKGKNVSIALILLCIVQITSSVSNAFKLDQMAGLKEEGKKIKAALKIYRKDFTADFYYLLLSLIPILILNAALISYQSFLEIVDADPTAELRSEHEKLIKLQMAAISCMFFQILSLTFSPISSFARKCLVLANIARLVIACLALQTLKAAPSFSMRLDFLTASEYYLEVVQSITILLITFTCLQIYCGIALET